MKSKRKQDRNAVAYLRVSSEGQKERSGFARQRACIESWAKAHGYRIQDWYKEAHTGTEADRPVFTQMIQELLANGARTVIVESMDRLARDLMVSHQLIALLVRKDITLISASTNQNVTQSMSRDPMMKALTQIQSVFAELEKNLLVRKLQTAREMKRQKEGRCEGRKPFGFYSGEQKVLKLITELKRKPRKGKRRGPWTIAQILNEEGHATRSGRPWSGQTVKQILRRS